MFLLLNNHFISKYSPVKTTPIINSLTPICFDCIPEAFVPMIQDSCLHKLALDNVIYYRLTVQSRMCDWNLSRVQKIITKNRYTM